EQVVERVATGLGRIERDRELLLDALLADEVVERRRPKRTLELLFSSILQNWCNDAVTHAAFFNACRTCSSIGSDSSTPANARSASSIDQPSSTSASRAST